MNGLKKVLQDARERRNKAGGALSLEVTQALRAYRKQQLIIFIIFEIVLVLAIGYCVYLVTQGGSASRNIPVISGLIGIGAGGGVEVVRRIWREWAQADLLILLLPESTEAQANAIMERLIKGL